MLKKEALYREMKTPHGAILALLFLLSLYMRLPAYAHPFWFDEVWRANVLSCQDGVFDCALKNDRPPISIGLTLITRLLLTILPNAEFIIRLTSAAASLLTPFIAFWLLRTIHSTAAGIIGATVFTLAMPYLDLGTQFKPFIVEAFFVVLLLSSLASYAADPSARRRYMVFGVTALGAFFSTPLIFFAPAAVGYISLDAIKRRDKKAFLTIAMMAGLFLALFGLYYFYYLKPQVTSDVTSYWNDQLPSQPGFSGAVTYIRENFLAIFRNDVLPFSPSLPFMNFIDGHYAYIVAGLYLIGCVAASRRGFLWVVLTVNFALVVTIAMAFARIWPFGSNRTNLFIFAAMTCLACCGVGVIFQGVAQRSRPLAIGMTMLAAITFFPVKSFDVFGVPRRDLDRTMSEMRRGIAYLKKNLGPNSVIIVYHPMLKEGFQYYYDHYYYWDEDLRGGRPDVDVLFETAGREEQTRNEAFVHESFKRHRHAWLVIMGVTDEIQENVIAPAERLTGSKGEWKTIGHVQFAKFPGLL